MKAISRNRIIAVMVAIVVFMVAMCTYSSNAEASTSTRTYWRHDYGTYIADYYEYTLTTSTIDNNSRSIIGTNNMTRDYDTSIVRLGTGGTGFIVGDHVIATAAHCVYDNGFLEFTISVIDSNNNIIKVFIPEYVHVPKLYVESVGINDKETRWRNDYALIYVEENLSEYGILNLGLALEEYITKQGNVTVSGFPIENSYPSGYVGLEWGIRFKASDSLLALQDEGLLYYYADTANGVSGGPVYVDEGYVVNGTLYENRAVIAINRGHTEDEAYNVGVRINSDLLKFFCANTFLTV